MERFLLQLICVNYRHTVNRGIHVQRVTSSEYVALLRIEAYLDAVNDRAPTIHA